MKADWRSRLRQAAEALNVLLVNIYGISGSGKTNLAFYLYETIADKYSDLHIIHKPKELEKLMKREEKLENTVLVLEDFTYLAARHSKKVDEFLRNIMLIRHTLKHTAIIIITHYLTSVLPALRVSHVRAITSLTTQAELKQLSKYFDLQALWDYYALYLNNYSKFYALINVLGKHYIIKPPLTKTYIESHS